MSDNTGAHMYGSRIDVVSEITSYTDWRKRNLLDSQKNRWRPSRRNWPASGYCCQIRRPHDSPYSGRYSVCRTVEKRAFRQTVAWAVPSQSGLLLPGQRTQSPGKCSRSARRRSMGCDPSCIVRQVVEPVGVAASWNVVDILQIYPQNASAQTFGSALLMTGTLYIRWTRVTPKS